MRAHRVISAVDSHTEGMPTRVVTGGVGVIPGATMAERRQWFIDNSDDLRTLLMYEPRGHGSMSGSILQPPTRPDADYGVLFIEVSGLLPMCGHGTIGVATVLVETGMVEVVEPVTTVRLEVPAGLVEVLDEVLPAREHGGAGDDAHPAGDHSRRHPLGVGVDGVEDPLRAHVRSAPRRRPSRWPRARHAPAPV